MSRVETNNKYLTRGPEMLTIFAAAVTLTVLTAVGFGCYGLYKLECWVCRDR